MFRKSPKVNDAHYFSEKKVNYFAVGITGGDTVRKSRRVWVMAQWSAARVKFETDRTVIGQVGFARQGLY
jgi:hypothetical protein